jgi:ATP phosphoribosyltransferase
LVKVQDLEYGNGDLYIAASKASGISSAKELKTRQGSWRLASEYPNLAEAFALSLRLSRFVVFPVWGAAEVYPPESADLVLISQPAADRLSDYGLVPLSPILANRAFLIANRHSWEAKDMGEVLDLLCHCQIDVGKAESQPASAAAMPRPLVSEKMPEDTVWLALPDGHQQAPTIQLLSGSGLKIRGYSLLSADRRPTVDLAGVMVKVIRPQDMPLQVANGNFDLAITGRDWLMDHVCRFPSSPVKEILDLRFAMVKVVAVVSRELPVDDISELRELVRATCGLRVASEYVNIADKYARDNHLSPYKVIPTWGASEAFLPEDADLLIENTETGRTLARHNLKIIDTLFESSACLIGTASSLEHPAKRGRITSIVDMMRSPKALSL